MHLLKKLNLNQDRKRFDFLLEKLLANFFHIFLQLGPLPSSDASAVVVVFVVLDLVADDVEPI